MTKIKVSAVSYTNTKPFIYGLINSDVINHIDLSLDNPSDCAAKLINNKADIGLIPVAALLDIHGYEIIGDFCIGANGAVNSVFIFSNKPIQEVKIFQLDTESRTSNILAQVLLKYYWKLEVEFSYNDGDAFIEIGDRTFGKKANYSYAYDLAEEWKIFTGLPFAFAVWTANKNLPREFIAKFNEALKLGIEKIPELVATLEQRDDFDIQDYLLNKVDYTLDNEKRRAIDLFLEYAAQTKVNQIV